MSAAADFTRMETREASPTHSLVKIESFYNSGIAKFETKEFVAGEYRWKLIIHPNGDKTVEKDKDYVSVYLAMADTSSLPASWEVNVVFSIFLFDQISANYLCSLGILVILIFYLGGVCKNLIRSRSYRLWVKLVLSL
ncbi:PREDICTED: MATH domain and coiled-coil domain-containing protein At3g58410-like [Erythranthe guttata]|uniref:MATH domain and coiled-coil domain-containing protein At3g58410-like n=1 Tax=Erythranthe guttata TaxID=4155 RepID=UPI00064D995C|nr:PREDICTED: MATH domain and coiled-coil domain-containing protein At3g58410-like [Erythranthe guttata]|eukprot:XP_012833032.1 PREDICTED: MATH domain and coiled-coil domain-containing protein At3g58410-like [Erythranthe guttata]